MDPMTVGVEEELQVVDLATGELVPRGDDLLAAARASLGDQVTRELNLCQIETATPVCSSLDEVRESVAATRGGLLAAGRQVGLGVIATSTHPTGRWQDQQIDRTQPRYRALEQAYQALAHQQIICGCHIHVGFHDPEERYAAMAHARPWLPVLLALSASSPFWQGHDTGYASFRHQVWRRWPTSGLPPELSSAEEYEAVVEDLVAAGAVRDASYLYWDMRPSLRYPTLEVRAIDTLLHPDDVATMAGLVRALMWTSARAGALRVDRESPRSEVLDAAMWRASRYGVSDGLISPLTGEVVPTRTAVDELLEHCAEGLEVHGDAAAVAAGLEVILERGNGAVVQRAQAEAHGDDGAAIVGELLSWTGGGPVPTTLTAA